jgi:hypothetical protein
MNYLLLSILFWRTFPAALLCRSLFSMRHFLFFVAVSLCSCGVDSSEIGTDFFNEGALDISYIDSSSVKLYTVRFDSLITSDAQRILVGSHNDERLGRLTASAYFQPGLQSAVDLDEDNVSFDYAAITLKYDTYSYYDTASSITLTAYRVTEEIELEEDGYLYNTSEFSFSEEPLGSVTFSPRPHRKDSVEIILDEDFALDLYQKALEGDDDLATNAEFIEYLKGIAIIPDSSGSTAIVGFAMPEIRLYYIDKSITPTDQRYVSFPVSGGQASNLHFNNIRTNRTATKLAIMPDFEGKLSADITDEEAYLQAGAGLALRVDFPYLRNLTANTNFFVTKAVLDIYPVRKSYGELAPLPSALIPYKVDKKNNTLYQFPFNATLYEDIDLGRDTRYSLDVTSFVKEQMAITEFNENALLFVIENASFRGGVDRIYAASPGSQYKTRLTIYYATVNNY